MRTFEILESRDVPGDIIGLAEMQPPPPAEIMTPMDPISLGPDDVASAVPLQTLTISIINQVSDAILWGYHPDW